ncbi:MAG: non-histone chromosomal MC1 family protein [Methermicoccaceae archaeon]
MAEKKNFALRDETGNEIGVFTGRQPRQAALKAVNKLAKEKGATKENPVTVRLREKGTKKVHVFQGWTAEVDAPKNRPAWMPERITKPFVKKIGIEKLEKL